LVTFTKGAVQRTDLAGNAEPALPQVTIYIVFSVAYIADSASAATFCEAYIVALTVRLKGNPAFPLTGLTP